MDSILSLNRGEFFFNVISCFSFSKLGSPFFPNFYYDTTLIFQNRIYDIQIYLYSLLYALGAWSFIHVHIFVYPTFSFRSIACVLLKQIIWNLYTRSETVKRKPSSTMNFTTISIQELWSLICQKLRNNCIVFEELPGSIGDLTFADAVLLGNT